MRTCIDPLLRRAMLSAIPPRELEVIHEAQRRKGGTAHAQVHTPPYQMRQLLVQFAEVLDVPIERLLMPSTFKPTCEQPAADGLQSGKCCGACDGSCHEWLRWHNRLRAKFGANEPQKQRDAERLRRLLVIAQKLGAKVTKQALPLTIVARVLSDVLALDPPKEGEKKVPVEAAHTRCLQVVREWIVGDAYAERVDAIQLPMLHPETKELCSVRASDWVDEFEKLTGEVMSDAGDFDAMLSDAEEPEDEAMGEAAASGGGGGGVSARAFDPKCKTFKVDTKRLLALNSTLEAEAEAVATTKAAIDARLGELRNASQGEAGGFRAAFVLLQHPDEPKVLMARQERVERGGRVAKLNPIGGKRAGSETGRATAAREAKEETAGLLSRTAQRELRSGTRTTGAWEPWTRSFVYVHQLANPQDIFLHNNVPPRHAGHEQLRGVEWVAVTNLLDPAWCRQHCHFFCHEQLRIAAPLLQGQRDGDVVGAQGATAQEIQELDALCKDLARHESLHAVVRGMMQRCEGLVGWVELTDAYSYRGTGGRRYVDAAALPRVDGETVLERRTATLQGGHSDLRAVCCGEQAYDIDCENGDPRNLLSLAEQTALSHLVPTWIDYVENRAAYLKEICELHGCDASVAKRLPNVVGNGGSWGTWLRDNDLKPPAEGSKAFEGKKCKAFLPPTKCRRGEPNATRELEAIRAVLFEHPRFKAMVEAERERLVREGLKPRCKHDTSLWSRIMQTSEDEVLSIIDRALFELGWDVWALVFDGLIAAPSAACAEPDVKKALAAAQAACESAGGGGGERAHTHTHTVTQSVTRRPLLCASPFGACLARRPPWGETTPRGGGDGRRGPLRRGRATQLPVQRRRQWTRGGGCCWGATRTPLEAGEGRKGPAEARPRPTSARPARDLSSRRSPCKAFLVALGCTAHGVERPARRRAGACRRSRSQRLEPAFLTRCGASRLHVPTSGCGCASCACALSCGANHGTVARACWGRRATGASPTSHGACLPRSGGGGRCVTHWRSDGTTPPPQAGAPAARGRALGQS